MNVGGHDGLPEIRRRPVVTLQVGNDGEALFGAYAAARAWGLEEHNRIISAEGFAADFALKARSGNFVQILGTNEAGDFVASVELHVLRDPLLGLDRLYGDKLWVRADHRRAGLARQMIRYCIDFATTCGFTHWVVPVSAKGHGADFLKTVYEQEGFAVSGFMLAREVA
jgi:GNAT superfamily N-acetyltransferase